MISEVGKKKFLTNFEILLLNLQNPNTKKPNKIYIINLRFVVLKKLLLEEIIAKNINNDTRYPQICFVVMDFQDLFIIK